MEQSLLLSVVVPVYNSETFLHKCVQSILSQNFQDLEIIRVDDGSNDESPSICDEFEANYSKIITIHHNKNQGLLNARLTGARVARGLYLTFVDSDDFLDIDYFEKFAAVATSPFDVDVICGGCVMDYIHSSKVILPEFAEGLYNGKSKYELNNSFFSHKYSIYTGIYPCVWSKWFKREYVLPFIERADKRITYGEDLVVSYFAIIMAKNLYVLTSAMGYHYVQHPSMMSNNYPNDYLLRVQYVAEYVDKTINDYNLKEYQAQFDRHILLMYKRGFGEMISQKNKIELISEAASKKAFRDIFKSVSLFKIRGLTIGSKFYIWMIYNYKAYYVYLIVSSYSWMARLFKQIRQRITVNI